MKTTLSLIKADIGSIGGHVVPSKEVLESVKTHVKSTGLVKSFYVFTTGDDVSILMAHDKGKDNKDIHQLALQPSKDCTVQDKTY